MDRNLAVARTQAPIPHLRVADAVEPAAADEGSDGPTRMFTPDPSYRGPGAETSASVSEPAPSAPVGRSISVIEVDPDDVSEVLEGRLRFDTDPKAAAPHTVIAAHVPRGPEPVDRTCVGTPSPGTVVSERPVLRTPAPSGTQIVANPVMRTPEPSSTQIVANPVMRAPEPSSTQIVANPVMRTPAPSSTQIVANPVMRTPAPAQPELANTALAATPVPGAPVAEIPAAKPAAREAAAAVTAARVVVAGRYLMDGDDLGATEYALGKSFVLARTPRSPFADDPYVDAEHGALTFRPDGVVVEDFDSANGVFVRVRGHVALRSGDIFRAGEELLRFTALRGSKPAGRAPTLGSPDPGYWGRIDVMLTAEDNAASYPIDDVEASFGQTDGHVQFPDDPFLGALHCRVFKDDRGAVLEDFDSAAGTWLRLRTGDVVPYGAELLVGQTRLRLERA